MTRKRTSTRHGHTTTVVRMTVEKCESLRKLTINGEYENSSSFTRFLMQICIPVSSQNVNLTFILRCCEKFQSKKIPVMKYIQEEGRGKKEKEKIEKDAIERRGIDDGYDDDEKRGTFKDR